MAKRRNRNGGIISAKDAGYAHWMELGIRTPYTTQRAVTIPNKKRVASKNACRKKGRNNDARLSTEV